VNLSVSQQGDTVILGGIGGGSPTFQGHYTSNLVISGQGASDRTPDGVIDGFVHYVEKTLAVVDPDHLKYGDAFLYRASLPASHDVSCDEQDSFHVTGDYSAWIRGKMALQENDSKAARCWFALGTKWGFAPAESQLAAMLVQGSDGKPDYAFALQLAGDSALDGDVTGQMVLASMYQNGIGTVKDTGKAQYWLKKVEESKSAAQWAQWTSKSVYGFSPLELAGAALKMSISAFTIDQAQWERDHPRCYSPACRGVDY
jgi:hypothetical protein